ncbi:MAG: hypothetical protein RX318_12080 [bacterium]|nr:hypothetical protein [bacterium]
MKRLAIFLVAIFLASAARADPVSDVRKAVEMWGPIVVKMRPVTLRVVLNQQQITETIYEAVIFAGICAFVQAGLIDISGIEEIEVLNRFGYQGYVFEGGHQECRELYKTPRDRRNLHLLGMSRLYGK